MIERVTSTIVGTSAGGLKMAELGKEGVVSANEPFKSSVVEVVDLLSDSEEAVQNALEALAPDQVVRDDKSSTTEEGSSPGEYWESESLLEDTFGGISQELNGPRCRLRLLSFPGSIFLL